MEQLPGSEQLCVELRISKTPTVFCLTKVIRLPCCCSFLGAPVKALLGKLDPASLDAVALVDTCINFSNSYFAPISSLVASRSTKVYKYLFQLL